MTTGSELWLSRAVKSRPAMMGTPSAAKNPRGDHTPLSPRIIYAGGMDVAIPGELQTNTGAAAPGNGNAERRLAHARKRINAPHGFLVEIDYLLRRLSVCHR